jgi:hypothetical protein
LLLVGHQLPRRFLRGGYAVSSFNIQSDLSVDNGKSLAELIGDGGERVLDIPRQPPEYTALARQLLASADAGASGDGDGAKLLLSVSLFRSVPNFLRAALIDSGVFETESAGKFYSDAALPFLMPGFLSAGSDAPTFKIFANGLSHNPFLLGPDSPVPLFGEERRALTRSGSAHFHTDRHIIRQLEALVVRLKELGVYDNTRLILASDHDYQRDANPFLRGVGSPFGGSPPRPYALLLVKDFNAAAPLAVSDQLMQGSDMPALACAGLPEIPDAPPLPPDDPARVRLHHTGRSNLMHHTADSFMSLRKFLITGSMFDPSHWEEIEEKN